LDGFLAHEVSSIVPEAINGTKDQTETKTKLVYDSNDSLLAEDIEEADWIAGKSTQTKTKLVYNSSGSLLAEDIEESDWTTGKSDGTYPPDSTWVASKTVDQIYPSNSTWVASKEFPVYQGIDQAKLVPLLVKTIQELEARITTLEG